MKKNWKAMMIGAVMGTMAAGMAVGAQEKGTDAAEKPSGDITEEMAKKSR